ncbi:MAG TPA: aminotransferase class V-fold PLP-dependent enzyme [Acidimicrobiales bacterium]|nr:aminotransferase class V-fold PLP-dependent enzyme [Acidimicrobiales bacterium]
MSAAPKAVKVTRVCTGYVAVAMPPTNAIDIAAVRADTAWCEHRAHLDNAGSSLPPRAVTDAVIEHLRLEEMLGGYAAEAEHLSQLEDAYEACADLVGATRDEIALFESATTAWQMAFHSIPFEVGDHILTCVAEYASNYLAYLRLAQRVRVVIDVVPDDEHGQIDIGQAAEMITDRTKLISITHVPTNGGLVNPAEAIGAIARAHDITYLVDACQSVGQLPIDVGAIGCDFLSFTGRKFLRGPRGTGALFARARSSSGQPALIDLHSATWTGRTSYDLRADARRFENYESNIAARIGLGVAARYAQQVGLDASWARIQQLADRLRGRLADIDGVTVRDKGALQCGIVTFDIVGIDSAPIKAALARNNVVVNLTHRRSTLLDMTQRGIESMVRASVHYFNTDDEVDHAAELVASIARGSAQGLR